MANNGNGIGSSVSGTDPTEQIMERAVTSFLRALQTNINNGLPERREEPITIKQFQDLKPTIFTGSTNPLVEEAWVRDMEKIFRALPCTERQKVTFATFTFKDDAQEYSVRKQKKPEFIHLRQGTMIVAEYESKFTQLARFTTYVIPTEAQNTKKFEARLHPKIKDRLEVLKLPTYAAVVDGAYIAEKGIKALRSGNQARGSGFGKEITEDPVSCLPRE
ncbi:uncharacterized protein LOC114288593 [Camellia sinensis]|uniref:uncharacterized protein LOC114288593 n=1 Tax=Camellia sinensis TaxID=4442 RepID=UPI0010355661|nr:uncharacterized protein LOC114288593 [Camellia sinensis]